MSLVERGSNRECKQGLGARYTVGAATEEIFCSNSAILFITSIVDIDTGLLICDANPR